MNKERRKRIEALQEQIAGIALELEELMNEEQEAHDNLPESIQETESGERMQSAADALEEAYSSMDSVHDNLTEALEM